MRFFGKREIDDAILYNEIRDVMVNFGVNMATPKTSPKEEEVKSDPIILFSQTNMTQDISTVSNVNKKKSRRR